VSADLTGRPGRPGRRGSTRGSPSSPRPFLLVRGLILVAAGAASLDVLSVTPLRDGRHYTPRWLLLHLIEATARPAGHLDQLREATDAGHRRVAAWSRPRTRGTGAVTLALCTTKDTAGRLGPAWSGRPGPR